MVRDVDEADVPACLHQFLGHGELGGLGGRGRPFGEVDDGVRGVVVVERMGSVRFAVVLDGGVKVMRREALRVQEVA